MTLPSHDEMQWLALNHAWDLGLDAAMDHWLPGAGYCDLVVLRHRRPLVVVEFKSRVLNVGQLINAAGQVRRYCRWYPSHGFEMPAAYVVAAALEPDLDCVVERGPHRTDPVVVTDWASFDLASLPALKAVAA